VTGQGPRLVAVVAMAENGVIGVDNRLPWRLPADLRRFKAITLGKPVLMGRRTFDSIGRPLPGRQNIVLTQDPSWSAEGVVAAHSLGEALGAAGHAAELMVIGGAGVYALCWPHVERLELTLVHARPEGDTRLADFDWADWRELARERHCADERHDHDYSFITLERREPLRAPAGD
jgi:dihydrofolate reductase